MEWFFVPFDANILPDFDEWVGDWFFIVSISVLAFEFVRYALARQLTWLVAGDALVNFLTFIAFTFLRLGLYAALYVLVYYWVWQFAFLNIPTSLFTILIALVLADMAYYWEHRFSHRMGLAWATHSVHHSSPNYNISVAYRFGPMDGFWSIPFHLPLILIGFHPLVIFSCEILVQLYQTLLHTESVKKLPKPVELVMNMPSHHRVHHASDVSYLDKNYGGIFIVWDRWFDTFAREEETPTYGLVTPIDTLNPLSVFFHGFTRLFKTTWQSKNLGHLWHPPGWQPKSPTPKSDDKDQA